MENRDPISAKALIATLLVTVVGGVIVALIAGEGRFAALWTPTETSESPTTSESPDSSSGAEEIKSCLDAPVLLEPRDDSKLETLIPLLRWRQASSVGSRVELTMHSDFSKAEISWDIGSTREELHELKVTDNLKPNTLYHWRVTVLCDGGSSSLKENSGGSSTGYFFSGLNGDILPAPAAIAPSENSIVIGKSIFQWSRVEGAKGYLLFDGGTLFNLPNERLVTKGSYVEIEHAIVTSGDRAWNVAGYNDYAIGSYSPIIRYVAKLQ